MPIDRRITNGLAWAGALLVVAIPAADVALNQLGPQSAPQVAVVEAEVEPRVIGPSLPTPVSQRPVPASVADRPAQSTPTKPSPVSTPDPITTASAKPVTASGDAVDDFLRSGRPLPNYISEAGSADPAPPPATSTASVAAPLPEQVGPPLAASPVQAVAAISPKAVKGFPTPVSLRPVTVARPQQAVAPALVVEPQAPVITAADLEEWESGPLSEFLARRQATAGQGPSEYDPDGFFLDEGPNGKPPRFPRAYNDNFWPFE